MTASTRRPTVDRPWIQFPATTAVSDWGGVAIDPEKGIMIANYNNMPNYNQLVPREEVTPLGILPITDPELRPEPAAARTAASARRRSRPTASASTPAGACRSPGCCARSRPTAGSRPSTSTRAKCSGTAPSDGPPNGPFGIPSMLPIDIGTPNNGGGVITASGLFFIAAATDDIRAIDIETGRRGLAGDVCRPAARPRR
jgi:quinoprotein glucose dehydrogenase